MGIWKTLRVSHIPTTRATTTNYFLTKRYTNIPLGTKDRSDQQNAESFKALRLKQQHALERLIDSFTEGLIEKDQFTSRMARTKGRIAELDAQIQAYSGDVDQMENVRLAAERLREFSATIGPDLVDADWHRRRELIRAFVQKVEIGKDDVRIVFRLFPDGVRSGPESIAVTVPR